MGFAAKGKRDFLCLRGKSRPCLLGGKKGAAVCPGALFTIHVPIA
jgi:hypothetical protein